MPASQYGEPKFPVRLSYATSPEQEKALRTLAGTEEFESLGDCIRTLITEALDMRKDIEKAEQEFAETDEDSQVCEVVTTDAGTALVRGPRSLTPKERADVAEATAAAVKEFVADEKRQEGGAVGRDRPPVGMTRVGNQLAGRPVSRQELIAQERGE